MEKRAHVKRTIIVSIIIGLLGIFLYYFRPIASVGSEISASRLMRDVKKINEVELEVEGIKLTNNGTYSDHIITDKEGNIVSGSKIVEVFVQNKQSDFTDPLEVRAAMRIWLYLQRHVMDFPIVGVYVWFDIAWIMDAPAEVFVSKADFENTLVQINNHEQLSDEALIRELSRVWIQNHNYIPKKR